MCACLKHAYTYFDHVLAPLSMHAYVGIKMPCKESFYFKNHAGLILHWLGRALHPSWISIKSLKCSFPKTPNSLENSESSRAFLGQSLAT